jgi:hypothetical protein
MAQSLFEDTGYSVFVRRTENLTECKQMSDGSGVWVVPPSDLVTEFLYSPKAICVSLFVRSDEAGDGTVRFDARSFEDKFGPVPAGEFAVRQRFAFVFPEDPSTPPDETTLEIFFRSVPRPVNLQRPGSLGSAMKEIESPEAGSRFASEVSSTPSTTPKDRTASADVDKPWGTGLDWKAAGILLAGISLFGGTVFLFLRTRSYARQAAKATQEAVSQKLATPERPIAKTPPPPLKRSGRRMLSLPVNSDEDRKILDQINALIVQLTAESGMRWSEVEDVLKKAHGINKLAMQENLPPWSWSRSSCPIK